MHDAQNQNNINTNTLTKNARTTGLEPYNTVNRKIHEQRQPKRKMPDIQFHDPDEQHWAAIEQREIDKMNHIPP